MQTNSHKRQVSVVLGPDLRTFVETTAARENRSVASLIRHLIAEAARRNGRTSAPLAPLPVRSEIRNAGELAAAKQDLAALESERDELAARQKRSRFGLMPVDDDRLRYLNGEVYTRAKEVRQAEIMIGDAR